MATAQPGGQTLRRPIQTFLPNGSASTLLLLGATLLALIWANSPLAGSYETLWETPLGLQLGDGALELDLRHWVNDGLMALFFFVVGMEVSRDFARGEMRDRRKAIAPVLAALGGLAVPIALYLSFTAGTPGAVGWGIPMATDTAFVLGMLTLAGPRCPQPLRAFLLTLAVVDDVGAIAVVAIAYTRDFRLTALLGALALFGVLLLLRRIGEWRAPAYVLVAMAIWVLTVMSGVHPTVVGLALGAVVQAYHPPDARILRAGELARDFLHRPTPERGRAAAQSVRSAVPANERLLLLLNPWTSYLVVPVFALANAGIPLDPQTLLRAARSPVTLGVLAGLALGKPIGVCLGSWIGIRTRLSTLPGNLVWGQLTGGAALAGIGFTVSLFITELAFTDEALRTEAKIGILAGSLLAALAGRIVFWLAWDHGAVCAPDEVAEDEQGELPTRLAQPVGPQEHSRGAEDARVTLVEYGDFECAHCGQLYPVLEQLMRRYPSQLRLVFRHFPVDEVHPYARQAAQAAEVAAGHGRFWQMHRQLFTHQRHLRRTDLAAHAEATGIDGAEMAVDKLAAHAERVASDQQSGVHSGVRGAPALFVNGERYRGRLALRSLSAAVDRALAATSRSGR